jgi:hypothetical protein
VGVQMCHPPPRYPGNLQKTGRGLASNVGKVNAKASLPSPRECVIEAGAISALLIQFSLAGFDADFPPQTESEAGEKNLCDQRRCLEGLALQYLGLPWL